MRDGGAAELSQGGIEPLVRMADLDEYREGLERHFAGVWDDERWTAHRVRFGVYGQKQAGVQMIRIKIPGGIMPVRWLSAIAHVNRDFAVGDAHITTRQDIQIYSVPLAHSPDALEALYAAGLTTREACGNTLRNVTACALAGVCPRERVDAGQVADGLARSWLRQPLVQHMPRKVKISVSGCDTDCGAGAIHDLAFVATESAGRPGFRVLAGGGLGAAPRSAVEVLPFAVEEELPAVVETLARLHQRYSDRSNRNASRVKFVLKRFGEEKFRALFAEEFARLRDLPQRPWQSLAWRQPGEAAVARTPVGVIGQHDGRIAVVAAPPLGLLSSDQLDAIAAIADAAGVRQLRTTRDQKLALIGLAPAEVAGVMARLRAIGVPVPEEAAAAPDVISCPGTTTCRIGITNSQNFAREILAESAVAADAAGIAVRVSGCQNSCGLHHVGDFGFHGMAKKVGGQSAPHYQIHLGGSTGAGGQVAIAGPIVPARHAATALGLLRGGYVGGRNAGESVRGWAERLGKDGIAGLLAPLSGLGDDGLFVDWGEAGPFPGAPQTRGECAAPFAADDMLADLADDALINLDRCLFAGRWREALNHGAEAVDYAARRLLLARGVAVEDEPPAVVIELLRRRLTGEADLLGIVEAVEGDRIAAVSSGQADAYREAVALWLDAVRAAVEAGAPAWVRAEEAAE